MKWLYILPILFLLVVGCSTSPSYTQPETTIPQQSSPIVKPPAETKTFDPITITGTGDKTSPPFTVTTEEWVINWSFVPDSEYPDLAVLGFYVYPRGETAAYVESVAMPSGTSGSTYSYAGPGDYYVKVISANIESWTIIITPPN
jgi:hypothetical protein